MSAIVTAQTQLVSLLAADNFFSDALAGGTDSPPPGYIPVLAQIKGDVVNALQSALQKIGAGVVVMLPLVLFPDNRTIRIALSLKFAVMVTTNPTLNRTGKTAEAIIEKVIKLVHFKPNGVSVGHARPGLFSIDRNAASMDLPIKATAAFNNYIVRVNTDINL